MAENYSTHTTPNDTKIQQDFQVLDKDSHETIKIVQKLGTRMKEELGELQQAKKDLERAAADIEKIKKTKKADEQGETVVVDSVKQQIQDADASIQEAFKLIADVHDTAQEFAKGTEKALQDLEEEERALRDLKKRF